MIDFFQALQVDFTDISNLTDNSNDSINTATPLGTLVPEVPITRQATINDFDRVDYYRLTVNTPLTSGVALQNLTDNLDVAVLDSDSNLIARGDNLGPSDEAFQVAFSTPGEYFINVFQTAPGVASNYDLTLFPAASPPPPSTISIQDIVDGNDEAVRNREDTAFIFKQDYLLGATPNTPVTIDLIGNNSGFDPLLEVYQLPKDSLLQVSQQAIPIAANDNGGGGVNARIGPGVLPDETVILPDNTLVEIPAQLTLSPDFNYLLRATYTELPRIPIGNYTLSASVPNGFISLTQVQLGNTVGDPIIGGDPSINGFSNQENFF